MRLLARFVPLLLAGAVSIAPALAAEPDTYVFDVLRHGQYRLAFIKLFKGKPTPDWVGAVVKAGEGVAAPMKTIDIGGKPYRLDHVCKVHDCAGNVLAVLWAAGGQRVWAAVVEGGGAPVLYGTPSPEQTEALTAAAKNG